MAEQFVLIENKDSYGLTWYEHAQPMDDVALAPADKKGDADFVAIIWPEPYCFEATPEEKKTTNRFPFTMEGKEQMVAWLNEQYQTRFDEWEAVRAKH